MSFARKTRLLAGAAIAVAATAIAVAGTPRGRWALSRVASMAEHRLGQSAPPLDAARRRLLDKLGGESLPDSASTRIVVHKSRRVAQVFVDERMLAEYPVALGGIPVGTKEREGDGRTPEGTYRICTRLDRSSYHLFLGLSYPSAADANAGLARSAIDAGLRDAIVDAEGTGSKPPWNTPLGGAVGLHGGGASFDWTLGCIAFEDSAIEEIWLLSRMGTCVDIHP